MSNSSLPIRIGNNSIPQLPGVYWFLDKNSKVLYVGKAKNLKNRLTSYQYLSPHALKTKKMISLATKIKHKVTDSEFEALILEAELIKTYQPYYNSLLKDDKSPLYIIITSSKFPQVKLTRKDQLKTLNIKSSNLFGPYPSGYQAKQVLKFLRKIFPFCNATPLQQQKHQACFYSHLGLCPGACTGKITPSDYQKNITNLKLFLRNKKKDVLKKMQLDILKASKIKDFETAINIRNQLQSLKALANAPKKPELELPLLEADISSQKLHTLLRMLRQHLSLPTKYPLQRIEAYDISNLEGKQATASMVVFINAKPSKADYKMFKIKSLNTPNDPQMLFEALSRRVAHPEWGIPNLIVIDGGVTQLKASLKAVPWNIPVVSIAKNPDRLVIVNDKKITKITLDPKNPATKLIQSLRDESHRFAKNYHLKLRDLKFLHQDRIKS